MATSATIADDKVSVPKYIIDIWVEQPSGKYKRVSPNANEYYATRFRGNHIEAYAGKKVVILTSYADGAKQLAVNSSSSTSYTKVGSKANAFEFTIPSNATGDGRLVLSNAYGYNINKSTGWCNNLTSSNFAAKSIKDYTVDMLENPEHLIVYSVRANTDLTVAHNGSAKTPSIANRTVTIKRLANNTAGTSASTLGTKTISYQWNSNVQNFTANKTYSFTFSQATVFAQKAVQSTVTYTLPSAPSASGYTFVAWHQNSVNGTLLGKSGDSINVSDYVDSNDEICIIPDYYKNTESAPTALPGYVATAILSDIWCTYNLYDASHIEFKIKSYDSLGALRETTTLIGYNPKFVGQSGGIRSNSITIYKGGKLVITSRFNTSDLLTPECGTIYEAYFSNTHPDTAGALETSLLGQDTWNVNVSETESRAYLVIVSN